MKLIIRDNSEDVVEWAANYVIKRIKVTKIYFFLNSDAVSIIHFVHRFFRVSVRGVVHGFTFKKR